VVATTTATTFVDATGLVPATTYTYVVRAVSAAGTSAASNPASASLVRTASGGRLFSATPDGGGYWMTSPSGVVTAHGDARPEGSLRGPVDRPVVSMASIPSGAGYWLVAADGGIFAFGDATFHGSLGAIRLDQPIVGMAATPDGHGYWLVAADGGIFCFGDAGYAGSLGGQPIPYPIVGMAAGPGDGYSLVDAAGRAVRFG
jgi:hypothetical protein